MCHTAQLLPAANESMRYEKKLAYRVLLPEFPRVAGCPRLDSPARELQPRGQHQPAPAVPLARAPGPPPARVRPRHPHPRPGHALLSLRQTRVPPRRQELEGLLRWASEVSHYKAVCSYCCCPGEVGTISGWGLQYTEPGGQGSQPGVLQVGSHL